MRVGVDILYSTVTSASTSCVATFKVYTENQAAYNDSQTLNYGGTWATQPAPTNFTNNSGTGAVLRDTKTYSYTYPPAGGGSTRTFSATISGAFNGVTPTVTVTATFPQRPGGVPDPPTGFTVTRVSDEQVNLAWVNHSTLEKPYTSLTVQRAEYLNGWGAFATIATPAPSVTSLVTTGTQPNRIYKYQIRANNTNGSSAWVAGVPALTWMTPAAPSNVVATPSGSGSSVTVTWTRNNYTTNQADPGTRVGQKVERSVNGAAWTVVASNLDASQWIDPSPPASGSIQYRVSAVVQNNGLSSTATLSNLISSGVAPLAPTNLYPYLPYQGNDLANGHTQLSWTHNPGTDNVPQSAFQLRFSSDNGQTWTTSAVVESGTSSYTVPAGLVPNNAVYQWQVATRGLVEPGFGPWSESAMIRASTRGTLTLDPLNPAPQTNLPPLSVGWTWDQAEGLSAVRFEVRLTDVTTGLLLETQTVPRPVTEPSPQQEPEPVLEGIPTGTTFAYKPNDGQVFKIEARAQFQDLQWSAWVSAETTFVALPPAPATVVATFDECSGTVVLQIEAAAGIPGTSIPAVAASVYRRVNEEEWSLLVDLVPLPTNVIDVLPTTHGVNEYSILSVSTLPTYTTGPPTFVQMVHGQQVGHAAPSGPWVYLSYGPDYATVLRMRGDIDISSVTGRARESQAILGRKLPIALLGHLVSRIVRVKGTIRDPFICPTPSPYALPCGFDSPRDDWERASWESELVCFRDFTGRRVFGIMSDLTVSDGSILGWSDISFEVEQIDVTEPRITVGPLETEQPSPAPPPVGP
jgi:hypothetical protein